ncbi:MAG: hypothetical protein HY865_07310, partial [Chloroflexi bacterium]|nr:hypothetical protein [Chloroflexota bacterium]
MNRKLVFVTVCVLILLQACASPSPAPAIEPTKTVTVASSTSTPMPTATPTSAPTPIPLAWTQVYDGQDFERDMVTAFATDKTDANIIYAGMKNSGVYKTIDGGLSWSPVNQGLTSTKMSSLVISPQNPLVLYAGTMDGIFNTNNGGEDWLRINNGSHVLMDMQDGSHLYARDETNIYETTNQGKSWKTVYSFKEGCPDKIRSWAIHPLDGKTLFIGAGEECEPTIYLSSDGGNTWVLEEKGNICLDGLVIGLDRQGNYSINSSCEDWSVSIPTSTLDTEYYFVDSNFYRQNLNEEQKLILGNPGIGFVTAITISPDDPNTIYVGGEGIAVSRDGGLTWTELNNGLGSALLHLEAGKGIKRALYGLAGKCQGIRIPLRVPRSGSHVLHEIEQSLFSSTDGGKTWKFIDQPGCNLIKDADGMTVYRVGGSPGGVSEGWIWRSKDVGKSWEKLLTPDRVIALTADQNQSGLLYVNLVEWDVWTNKQKVSTDYGHRWKSKIPTEDIKICYGSTLHFIDAYRPMAIDPQDGNHVLVIDNGVLLESHDSCDSTGVFSTAPSTNMNSIAFDPNNSDILYAGTDGGAYITFDGGATWGQVNDGLVGSDIVYSI